jgi:hypothetical protein
MTGDDMHTELEQLRAEVAALSAARASKQTVETPSETTPDETTPDESHMNVSDETSEIIEQARDAVADDPELEGQFDQLIGHLEKEIKDLPAITTLAVFSLGVLFGRLLK